ncbi:MAG: helix-turn-helix domain-containing protein [Ruminiclostridium sp.]|nr:helix-turn-helix domain-containing protein [Ruminiclostridium sp.]
METYEMIKLLREERGFSQGQLAEMVGYRDRSSIAKIESGKVDLSQSKIAAFAKALGVTPAYLMGYQEENEDPAILEFEKLSDEAEALLKKAGFAVEFVESYRNPTSVIVKKGSTQIVASESDFVRAYEIVSAAESTPSVASFLTELQYVSLPKNLSPLPKTYNVPLVGNIACGQPILAVEDADEVVSVPEDIQADFALRCQGDSMITARIFDGDVVYIKQQPEVETGQIAAVRIGDEATLKKVYYSHDDSRITLRACNPLYPDLVYEGTGLNEIEILGLAVGFFSRVRHE